RVLVRRGYLTSEQYLFCPTFAAKFPGPRMQNFRYAFNSSALDTGGATGGSNNLEHDSHDIWFARCLWVPREKSFTPTAEEMAYPHGENNDRENALKSNSRVELRDGRADFLAQ